MKFKIHRGTKEIGGSCVEIWTDSTRILLDFGLPLVEKEGSDFEFSQYKSLDVNTLVQIGILPDIKGLYDDDKLINGVIISHPHQDHYGLINYVNNKIKFFMGEATHKIIELNNLFSSQNINITDISYFVKEKTFRIGDISITPYWADHSAFDSYSLLVEANGKSLFYSGDFRGHGRKAKAFKWLTYNPPQNVDFLLLEGTTIGRNNHQFKSEIKIESELIKIFQVPRKINLVYTSSQNIDRLVSIYKACNKTRKTLVVDVYVAKILKELSKFACIPYPSDAFQNLKVVFPYFLCKRLKQEGFEAVMYEFKKSKITKSEISNQQENIVMVVRPSMKKDMDFINGLEQGNIIYSMWEGYIKKPETKNFIDYFLGNGFKYHNIHTSGHADIKALKQMVSAISPCYIVPIHTNKSSEYQQLFSQPIIELEDGETVII
jgi:ribonuclease J